MDRCAIFIDAGHLLAEGGKLCCGIGKRSEVHCAHAEFLVSLAAMASERCGLPVLRTYWYDGARNATIHVPYHQVIASLPHVKLRLGHLSGGRQKGVDALIYRDLMTLARERAICTAYLLAGDESSPVLTPASRRNSTFS